MKCMRKLQRISYLERKTNELVRARVQSFVGPREPLLATVKRRKLQWFGHVTRHDPFSKTILQGTVEGGRKHDRQRKSWLDNVKGWKTLSMPELLIEATYRAGWRHTSVSPSAVSPNDETSSRKYSFIKYVVLYKLNLLK